MRFLRLVCLAGPALAQVSTISSCQTVFTDKALTTVKTYGNTESGTTESTRYKTLKSTITVTASPPADKTSVFRITEIVATRTVTNNSIPSTVFKTKYATTTVTSTVYQADYTITEVGYVTVTTSVTSVVPTSGGFTPIAQQLRASARTAMYSGMPVRKRALEERRSPGTIPAFVICDVLLQTTKTIFSTTTAMVTKTIKLPANTVTVTSSLSGTYTTTVPGTNNPTSTVFTSLFKTQIFTITALGGSTTVTTAFPVTTTSIIPYYAACDGALANGNYVDTVNDMGIGNAPWGVSSSSQQLQNLGILSLRDCCVAGQANSAGTFWEIASQKCWGVPLGNLPGDFGGFCAPDITNGYFRLQVGEKTPRVVVSNGGCGFVEMREGGVYMNFVFSRESMSSMMARYKLTEREHIEGEE